MSQVDRKDIGNSGEQRAAEFLVSKGYTIVASNFRHKRGEVDIIAQNAGLLVFVEVKTRNNLNYGTPENFVTPRQQELILETANAYIDEKDWKGQIRFDIIAIVPRKEISHFEDAFY